MADTLKAELEAILRSAVDAMNSSDHEVYASYHTQDCEAMYHDNDTVNGREGVRIHRDRTLKSHNINSSALEGIDYLQVLSDNKVYSTVSVNSVDSKGTTVARFRLIILWRKDEGKWLIERKFVNLKELPPKAQAQADIKAQIAVLYDGFNRKDVDTILQVYTDEATWLSHGHEDIKVGREVIQRMLPFLKTMVLDDMFHFELFGDDVAHTNAYINFIDESGKVYSRIRDDLLWMRVDGKWRIQRDAFNEVPLK